MYKPIPPIHETAEELKQRRQQERHWLKQQRLQALYLLASGQAKERQQVAALMGISRNTVGHWLDRYAQAVAWQGASPVAGATHQVARSVGTA